MVQLSKDGTAKLVDLPEGAALQKGVEKLDLGTSWQWHNTITGEPIGAPIPKNVAGVETAKVLGKAQGDKLADLSRVIENAEQSIRVIDETLAHPGLEGSVGLIQGRVGPYSDATAGFHRYHEQITGKAFLEAYQTLKGGGQITEVEGAKAEAAIARLNRVQSEEEYRKALGDFKDVIRSGVEKARREAGATLPPATTLSDDDYLKSLGLQ